MRWTSRTGAVSVVLETPRVMGRHYTGAHASRGHRVYRGSADLASSRKRCTMKGMRTTRRTFIATALCAAAAWPMPARAAEALVIEDWRESPTSATGVPPGWKPYETPGGHPAYDFSIVDDDGRRALRMKSDGEHSTIAKESTIRLAATPVLRW